MEKRGARPTLVSTILTHCTYAVVQSITTSATAKKNPLNSIYSFHGINKANDFDLFSMELCYVSQSHKSHDRPSTNQLARMIDNVKGYRTPAQLVFFGYRFEITLDE